MVVMIAGDTEMLGWELEQLVAHDLVHKLVIVMPPAHTVERRDRWLGFLYHLGGTPWAEAGTMVEPGTMLGCILLPDGSITAFTSSESRNFEYALFFRVVIATQGLLT